MSRAAQRYALILQHHFDPYETIQQVKIAKNLYLGLFWPQKSFVENWLTGALIGLEFDRDQCAAHLYQVNLTHLWQKTAKNGPKWPKIAILTVSLPGGSKLVDQT